MFCDELMAEEAIASHDLIADFLDAEGAEISPATDALPFLRKRGKSDQRMLQNFTRDCIPPNFTRG